MFKKQTAKFFRIFVAFSLLSTLVYFTTSNSNAVTVGVRTDGGTTLQVDLATSATIAANDTSIVFDFSSNIRRPANWSNSDLIAVEVALTAGSGDTAGRDDAPVDTTGGCRVEISSSTTSGVFDGVASTSVASTFILNDLTQQVSLQGTIQNVVDALKYVQVSCSNASNLVGKYVRVGAVPTVGSGTTSSDCGASNLTEGSISACSTLFYVFSTKRYYRVMRADSNWVIPRFFEQAANLTIPVDGQNKNVSTGQRRGWVATLATRDEIRLTNSMFITGGSNGDDRMIGTTDFTRSWAWQSNWGTRESNTANCSTDEGEFKWLGPDAWCDWVPAWNQRSASSYGTNNTRKKWKLNTGTNKWSPVTDDASTDFTIDFSLSSTPTSSTLTNTNGYDYAHQWHISSNGKPDEPNISGDWIYQGYSTNGGLPGWDDSGRSDESVRNSYTEPNNPGGTANMFYAEFCSGTTNNSCTPQEDAVDSIRLRYDQTISISTELGEAPAEGASVTNQNNTFTASTTSSLALSYASGDTSVCTVSSASAASGTSVTVTLLTANANCAITVSQAGDTNYNPAASVTRTFLSLFGRVVSCSGVGALQNGGFETPAITDSTIRDDASVASDPDRVSWLTTATDHKLEFWRSGFQSVSSAEGDQFAELNANQFAGLYQDISTLPGTVIRWSLQHRGRDGTESIRVLIGTNSGTTTYTSSTGATYSVPGTFSPATGVAATKGATTTNNIADGTSAWGTWSSSYSVPAGQTTTRFLFISHNPGASNNTTGNFLDDIKFSPLIACPATFTVVKGRTVDLNPFDLDNDGSGAGADTDGSSFGWNDASVSSTGLSASAGSVSRVTFGGVSNRAIRYVAPSTTGQQTIDFTITNTQGDTSSSRMTINVVEEASVRNINTLPIDPQATSYSLRSFTIDAGPDAVLACINSASDASGTISNSILVFDVGNIGTTDTTYTISPNTVTITGDRSDNMTLTGNLSAVNSIIGGLQVTRVGGSRFTTNQYVRIRSVPSVTVGQLNCANALASADRTLTLRPLELTRTKSAIVTVN